MSRAPTAALGGALALLQRVNSSNRSGELLILAVKGLSLIPQDLIWPQEAALCANAMSLGA